MLSVFYNIILSLHILRNGKTTYHYQTFQFKLCMNKRRRFSTSQLNSLKPSLRGAVARNGVRMRAKPLIPLLSNSRWARVSLCILLSSTVSISAQMTDRNETWCPRDQNSDLRTLFICIMMERRRNGMKVL